MRAPLLLLSFLLLGAGPSGSLGAGAERPLAAGDRVQVEAEIESDGRLIAESIEPTEQEDPTLRGPLRAWDPATGRLVLGPLVLRLDDASELLDEEGGRLAREDLAEGDRIKVSLEREDDVLRVKRVRRRRSTSMDLRIEATVEELGGDAATGTWLRVLGAVVGLTEETAWSGLAPPPVRARASTEAPVTGRLVAGAWVRVKGLAGEEGTLLASRVEPGEEQEWSLKGRLDAWSPAQRRLRMGPWVLVLEEETELVDEQGVRLAPSDFGVGEYVKASLSPAPGATPRVDRIRRRSGDSEKLRAEGPVEWVAPVVTDVLRFRLLGVVVSADDRTDWEGVLPPRLSEDDEDARPTDRISLGKAGWLSGEVRLDYKGEEDFDLAESLPDDLARLRLRSELEWTLPSTEHVSALLELRAESEWPLWDGRDREQQEEQLRLGEAWVKLSGVLGPRGSVQIGRSRWDDDRDWIYRATLDSLRLFFEFERVAVEAGVAQQLVNPSRTVQDARYLHLRITGYPSRRHEVAAWTLDRDDWYVDRFGEPRDFSPRWYGISARGRVKRRLRYWLDAALARGRFEGQPLRAEAWDVGLRLRLPGRWEPTLLLSRAFASGDADAQDGIDRTFRQSGLHGNTAKGSGLTSFGYYGEVLDPELGNLVIDSAGFGVTPRADFSVELVWHRYRQDEPSSRLVDAAAGEDRSLNLLDTDVGDEWDLIFAWERGEHWEVELDVGIFEPGSGFLGQPDRATGTFLKAKWVF